MRIYRNIRCSSLINIFLNTKLIYELLSRNTGSHTILIIEFRKLKL